MNALKINTFIGRQYDSNFPEVITDAVPITNPLAVDKAYNILEENEGDYLYGFVSLIYNDVVIFGEEQLTECLLDTWSTFSYLLESRYDGSKHHIIFLDNYPYINTTIQENGQYYEIQLDQYQCFLVPIEPFKKELKKEFFNFVEFCKNEKLWFSEESSYRGLLETYNEIKISK
ncbi:hypothetical protein FC756_18255 [Lysinibacillus mangiferihumi]|uniref:Uncharacterized protein n=1 Tax=Lysinibacillus mangiferihumi TaxID=1130819 RepID=A0A4U2YQB1_9BACI|nr:hypothetical protein [Lysinibacillus mangiferihumi]TKI63606.1 hypothetical protein FC756_18255 [Lysinibacillus mangiferihumi]